jgi:hypothetical protein
MSDLSESRPTTARRGSRGRPVLWIVLALVLLLILAVAWVGVRGLMAKRDLEQSVQLVGTLRSELVSGDSTAAQKTADDLQDHAAAARSLTGDPVWSAFQVLPFVGSNLRAVREVAVVVDDVATGAVKPVAGVIGDVNVKAFAPKDGKVDLAPLVKAQPAVQRATTTLAKADRDATAIDTSDTLSPVTRAVNQLRNAVASVSAQADVANRAVQLAPAMLGQDGDRRYLLLFQNNAELRAGGGIPGAVALLDVRDGAIHLSNQASGSSFGQTEQPVLPLSTDTKGLYGPITGEYMQDVTLTPRFDVSAELAREMWKQRFGQQVDGVLAMDPVTLASILEATGPVQLPTGDTLTSDNAVKLLLSDVYAKYPDGNVQDAFFASAASAVFVKVSSGAFDPKAFIAALTDAVQENRLRLWSADSAEQKPTAREQRRRAPVRDLPQRRHRREDGLLPAEDRRRRQRGLPRGRSPDLGGPGHPEEHGTCGRGHEPPGVRDGRRELRSGAGQGPDERRGLRGGGRDLPRLDAGRQSGCAAHRGGRSAPGRTGPDPARARAEHDVPRDVPGVREAGKGRCPGRVHPHDHAVPGAARDRRLRETCGLTSRFLDFPCPIVPPFRGSFECPSRYGSSGRVVCTG